MARQQNSFEKTSPRQRAQIQALTARLDEQEAKIQGVCEQIEMNDPGKQMAATDQ
jgi:hypothetical protein